MSRHQPIFGPCRLCLEHRRLCESHLLPRGIYTRSRGVGNTAPFIATIDGERMSQHQYKQPLLCGECEQRFNKNGEEYALGLMNSREHEFRLLEILTQSRHEPPGANDLWFQYSVQNTSGIDR